MLLSLGPRGAGLVAWPLGSALHTGQVLASNPSGILTPGGTFLPACSMLSFKFFLLLSLFFPPSDAGGAGGGRRGVKRSCAPLLPSGTGSGFGVSTGEAMFLRPAPSLGCLAGTLPVHPSGRGVGFLTHVLWVPGWTCLLGGQPVAVSLPSTELVPCIPRRHEAELCHVPPATDVLGEGRERGGGGQADPVRVGSGSKTHPRAAWHLEVHLGVLGVPGSHPVHPCALTQDLFTVPVMVGQITPFAPHTPLCAAKRPPGRCHMRHVPCPHPACSSKASMGLWLPGAQRGGSLGFWAPV